MERTSSGTQQGSTREILHAIARRKWLYLFLLTAIFIGSIYIFRYKFFKYRSEVTVIVLDGFVYDQKNISQGLPDFMLPSDPYNRIHQVINSTEMHRHLISRFHLYRHYGIDSTKEFSFERAVNVLKSNISSKKTTYNAVVISVTDRYRYVAAEIANEIASFANILNKRTLASIAQKRADIYGNIVTQLKRETDVKKTELENILRSLNASGSPQLADARDQLNRTIISLSTSVEELVRTMRQNLFVKEALSKDQYPSIVITQYAMAGADSFLQPALLISIPLVILCLMLIIFYHYSRLRFSDHIRIFTGTNSKKEG